MKVSQRSIKALGEVATGDKGISPYRSGPDLVDLFNEYGADDVYGQGFPSRWKYAEDRLRVLNGTDSLPGVITHVFDPREFVNTDFDVQISIDHVNPLLEYDGFQLAIENGRVKIRQLDGATVSFQSPFAKPLNDFHTFVDEQVEKADKKIRDGDYDGAITNARSLLEGVLRDIETNAEPASANTYDGDIAKLYKRVQKQLNLDPARPDLDQPLKQVLSGLSSIVLGLAAIRNRMSDAHVRSYRPSKHHAILVVNAAKTLANFLYEARSFQNQKSS